MFSQCYFKYLCRQQGNNLQLITYFTTRFNELSIYEIPVSYKKIYNELVLLLESFIVS